MINWIKQLLQSVFKIQQDEIAITGVMFVYLLSAIGAFIVGRITRSVLFLEIPDFKTQLPYMYIGIAIAVSIIMFMYAKVERNLRRDKTNILTLYILLLLTLVSRYLFDYTGRWFYWVFYIWIEIFGAFLIVQFWSLANEIFHSRQAKRLFAVIGSGGVLANIVAGFGIKGVAKALGTENLLFIVAALLIVAIVCVHYVSRLASEELITAHQKAVPYKRTQHNLKIPVKEPIFASRHLRTIAMIVVITYLVSTVIDYQFQVVIADFIQAKDARSAYFGMFFGITGILAGFIQLFITGRLLERFGVLIALLLLPFAMLSGSFLMAILPTLWIASYTKGSENVLRYTVNDATLQLLYLPVPAAQRGRAKTFIDGILRPLSIGTGGLLLALLSGSFAESLGWKVETQHFSILAIILLIAWIILLFRLKGEYVRSLLSTLQRRRLDFSDASLKISDEATLKVIVEALNSEKRGYILHALELIQFVEKVDEDMQQAVVMLLSSQESTVRMRALNFISTGKVRISYDNLEEFLEDKDEDVRAAAIRAYCALGREKAVNRLDSFLEDDSSIVRSSAVSALIRFGGLDGVLRSAETLKNMLNAEDSLLREKGAWVLGDIGVKTFYQPLLPLLNDESEHVRGHALDAAGKLLAPELVSVLVERLEDSVVAHRAISALINYGQEIEEKLLVAFVNEDVSLAIRRNIPRVLSRIGKSESVQILQQYCDYQDLHLRYQAIRALNYMLSIQPGIRIDEHSIKECIRKEVQDIYDLMVVEMDIVAPKEHALLLKDSLQSRKKSSLERVFRLLNLIYPGSTLDVVHRNLQSHQLTVRANAIELLDNLLDSDEKSMLLPLIEGKSIEQLVKEYPHRLQRLSRKKRLVDLMDRRDPWLRVCALYLVGIFETEDALSHVKKCLHDEDAVVRQTALWTLRSITGIKERQKLAKNLCDDEHHMVRDYANFVMQEA